MRSKWVAAAVLAAGLAVGPLATPAQGQPPGHEVETIECAGLGTIDISTQRSDNRGAVQIIGTKGHLIPVRFSFTLENLTTGMVLFDETEPLRGKAHQNQATTTCSLSFTGTWEEVGEPGEEPPPGVEPDDILRFTFMAEVVAKA